MPLSLDPEIFYNEHDAYKEWRSGNNPKREQYLDEIVTFKCRHIATYFPSIPGLENVLEIGCMVGDLIAYLPVDIPMSRRYGVDISSENIKAARELYPEINFFSGTFDEFVKKFVPGDIEGLTIDTVILSDILEHVEDDVDLLRKAGSYARYVLVNVPMERCWLTRNRNYGKNDISGHLRAYDLPHVKRIIHEAGLTIMDYDIRCLMKEPVYRRRYFKSSKSFLKSLLITWPKYLLKRLLLLLYPHYASRNFFALLTRNNHHEKT